MELEYAFEPLRLRSHKTNEVEQEENNIWKMIGPETEPARLSIYTTKTNSTSALTPAENIAFDELLAQISANYEFDLSVVQDCSNETKNQRNLETSDNDLDNSLYFENMDYDLKISHGNYNLESFNDKSTELGADFFRGSKKGVITKELSLSCVLAIPEQILPTSHAIFLKKYKESTAKVRSALTKVSNKWDNEEVPHVVKLGGNRLLINNKLVHVDYTNFISESDVVLKLDPDHYGNINGRYQESSEVSCPVAHCRLGCVCDSITTESVERSHCGRPNCFFECSCLSKDLTAISDFTDMRARLRPRRSLFNWKRLGRTRNETDPDFIKRTPLPILKEQMQVGTSQSVIWNLKERNVQPHTAKLRNEFVFNDGKRNSFSDARKLQLKRPENKIENLNIKRRSELLTNQKQVCSPPIVIKGKEMGLPCPSPSLLPNLRESKQQSVKDLKKRKSNISARYIYNYPILRRIHKCPPCSIRLARLESMNLSTPCPNDKRVQPRQVAMKSTAKRSSGLSRRNPVSVQKKSPALKSRIVDPLLVTEAREKNTFVILRENGTILTFLYWSSRKHCIPTAKKYEPEFGDSNDYPWLRLPIPPLDHGWIFYELPERYLSLEYIGIPGLQVMLRTQTIDNRIRETEIHGITQKLDVRDYLVPTKKTNYGSIYIVKHLPTVLICGPLLKKWLKPMSIGRQLGAQDFLNFATKEYPDPDKFRRKINPLNKINTTELNEEMDVNELSDDNISTIVLDNETRDSDLIPPEVMMQHYRSFMINMDSSNEFNKHSERHFDFSYEFDCKFGKERLYSPSDLVMDLEDPHTEEIEQKLKYSKTMTDEESSLPLDYRDDVIVIDDVEEDRVVSKSNLDLKVDHLSNQASKVSRGIVDQLETPEVVSSFTKSQSSNSSRATNLSRVPLPGNSNMVAPLHDNSSSVNDEVIFID